MLNSSSMIFTLSICSIRIQKIYFDILLSAWNLWYSFYNRNICSAANSKGHLYFCMVLADGSDHGKKLAKKCWKFNISSEQLAIMPWIWFQWHKKEGDGAKIKEASKKSSTCEISIILIISKAPSWCLQQCFNFLCNYIVWNFLVFPLGKRSLGMRRCLHESWFFLTFSTFA